MYHVKGPITTRDKNNTSFLQKIRELCASLLAISFSSTSLNDSNNIDLTNTAVDITLTATINKNSVKKPNEFMQKQQHKMRI